MKKLLFVFVLMLCAPNVFAASVKCMIGSTPCVKSQGTEIPAKVARDLIFNCIDFTRHDTGRIVLRMSIQKILEVSGKNINHPIYNSYYAFTQIYDSPLQFDRKSNAEDTNYNQIKNSCNQLNSDFNNDSKWTNM